MHFDLTVEGKGAWVLFIHFSLLLYFVNFLLLFLTFEGRRGHGFFKNFLKEKKNLEGGRGGGGGVSFFFLHFLLLFYYLELFVTFCLFLKGEGGHEFFFIFFYS